MFICHDVDDVLEYIKDNDIIIDIVIRDNKHSLTSKADNNKEKFRRDILKFDCQQIFITKPPNYIIFYDDIFDGSFGGYQSSLLNIFSFSGNIKQESRKYSYTPYIIGMGLLLAYIYPIKK